MVSLLNDTASEMITPLLPLFLTITLGAAPIVVGFTEGIAEAAASLLKLVSGRLADRGWRHQRLVIGGYGMSNIARPLIALAPVWAVVVCLRLLDRVGKGLRTAPRDALIAAAMESRNLGRAFGFHRAMDHAGAMLGPLCAFLLLAGGLNMQDVFLVSAVPGGLLILLLFLGLPSQASPAAPAVTTPSRWSALEPHLRSLILGTAGLALAAAPEAFLVLWAQQSGVAITWVPLLWAAAHGAKTLVSAPAGILADRIGRLPVLLLGWGSRVAALSVLAVAADGPIVVWTLFLIYATVLALTEGAERALISDLAPAAQKATAFGWYHMLAGLLALPGALIFGALWQWWGKSVAFGCAALLTAVAIGALLTTYRRVER